MQPLITQQGAYQEIPATSGGPQPGVGALVSVPGLQGAAFAASAGNSYLIDPTINTTATLADGEEDGQLVAFQAQTGVAGGGVLIVSGNLLNGAALGLNFGGTFETLESLRFRWNAEVTKWEPYGVSMFSIITAVPLPGPYMLQSKNGAASPIEVPPGSMPAVPLGATDFQAVPYPPPMLNGPLIQDAVPATFARNSVAYTNTINTGELYEVKFPELADGADGDTVAYKNLGTTDIATGVVFQNAADGALFENPLTGALVNAPGVTCVFLADRTSIVWKRINGIWYCVSVLRAL